MRKAVISLIHSYKDLLDEFTNSPRDEVRHNLYMNRFASQITNTSSCTGGSIGLLSRCWTHEHWHPPQYYGTPMISDRTRCNEIPTRKANLRLMANSTAKAADLQKSIIASCISDAPTCIGLATTMSVQRWWQNKRPRRREIRMRTNIWIAPFNITQPTTATNMLIYKRKCLIWTKIWIFIGKRNWKFHRSNLNIANSSSHAHKFSEHVNWPLWIHQAVLHPVEHNKMDFWPFIQPFNELKQSWKNS